MPRPIPNPSAKRIRTGRKRRTLGWTLLTLGIATAACWTVLRWWKLVIFGDGWGFALDCGALHLSSATGNRDELSVLWSRTHAPQWELWTGIESDSTFGSRSLSAGVFYYNSTPDIELRMVHVLLWPIPLLLCTPAALLLRSGYLARRRANTNACARCGYSLAGIAADALCPECGSSRGETDRLEKIHDDADDQG